MVGAEVAALVVTLNSKLTPRPQLRTIHPKQHHPNDAHDGQAAEETDALADAEVEVHRSGE